MDWCRAPQVQPAVARSFASWPSGLPPCCTNESSVSRFVFSQGDIETAPPHDRPLLIGYEYINGEDSRASASCRFFLVQEYLWQRQHAAPSRSSIIIEMYHWSNEPEVDTNIAERSSFFWSWYAAS